MKSLLKKLVKDERGTETVEWAIVIGIIAIAAITAAGVIGGFVRDAFSALANELSGQTPGPTT
jgi:Flp pilus assembly pilin Flp